MKTKINRFGIRYMVRSHLSIVLLTCIFILSAGRFDLIIGWAYFAIRFAIETTFSILFMLRNPDFINHRGESKKDSQSWDKHFFRAYIPLVFLFSIIAGVNRGRFPVMLLPVWVHYVGVVGLILSTGLSFWAMLTNEHFESTVRIQKDRNHQVINTGPYRFIRHPGYAAGILWFCSSTMFFRSTLLALVVAALIGIFVIRTYFEDAFLKRELPGYRDYSKKVRFRLLPGLW